MKNFKKLLSIFLVLMVVSLTACSSNNTATDTDTTTQENVLRVGMECAYAPYNWTQQDDSNGAVAIEGTSEYAGGYDVEVAKMVAEALGKELVIVKTEWDGLSPAVQSGVIDVIMAGMSPTAERAKEIDFTDPYWYSEYVLIVRKDSEYANATTFADFEGAKLTAQLNTTHYELLDQVTGADKQEAMGDFSQMRVALESGIIDGYVGEVPEAMSVEMARDDFVAIYFADGEGFVIEDNINAVAAGLMQGSELKDEINEVLNTLTEEDRQALMAEAVANQPAAE